VSTTKLQSFKSENPFIANFRYLLSAALLLGALGLSFISWLRICSQACSEGHNYRLFGMTFEAVGFVFFSLLIGMHLLTRKFDLCKTLMGWSLCAALGAEMMFIYVQKYKIGSWCPICLSIAGLMACVGFLYFYEYYANFKNSLEHGDKSQIMNMICKGFTGVVFFLTGFIIAFSGVAKQSRLQAAENSVKERIAFGNPDAVIEVFLFTDWACHGCRSLEPVIEAMVPEILQKARLTFVDDPVHPETLNYTPYNVSFMVNNKQNYLMLRKDLTTLSEDNGSPNDEQIEAIASKNGVRYKQLNYSDVALASKYFKELVSKLKVEGTPTLVVVNTKNKKGKKLEGTSEITSANVMKAIETLSSGK
jgi:hypothetical protein